MGVLLECLTHPAYSPDFTLYEFNKFEPLKEVLGGKKFNTDLKR